MSDDLDIDQLVQDAIAEGAKVTDEEHRAFMDRMAAVFTRRARQAEARGDIDIADSLTRLAAAAAEEAEGS